MFLSDTAIRRPIFTIMAMSALVLFGYLGYRALGINQFPNVDFPTVSVTTVLPGASPEVVESAVTDVIENELSSIEGIKHITSTSALGVSNISVEFELDRDVVAVTRESLMRFFPQVRGRAITHAWGGPIDVSPTHLPVFGSRGRVHHGFGFTGNGVGPSYLGGEILARLALDRRDERTRLALVEPPRKLFPPEPLRYAGGALIRRALVAKDAAEDEGREPSLPARIGASLPRRLGLHLPR